MGTQSGWRQGHETLTVHKELWTTEGIFAALFSHLCFWTSVRNLLSSSLSPLVWLVVTSLHSLHFLILSMGFLFFMLDFNYVILIGEHFHRTRCGHTVLAFYIDWVFAMNLGKWMFCWLFVCCESQFWF